MVSIHDKVIYPGHGVAEVEEVSEKLIGGAKVSFVKLVFLFKDMTVLVPTYNLKSIGVRVPSSAVIVETVFAELNKKPQRKLEAIDFTPSGWNRRYKEYQMRIQTGDLLEIAKIYRDLMHITQQKELSFGERGLLQTTEELLIQEIQIVQNNERDIVTQELRRPFKHVIFEKSATVDTLSYEHEVTSA
jgi:CarD family transcriptional regulator